MFYQGILSTNAWNCFLVKTFLVFTWEAHLLPQLESQYMEPNYRFNNPCWQKTIDYKQYDVFQKPLLCLMVFWEWIWRRKVFKDGILGNILPFNSWFLIKKILQMYLLYIRLSKTTWFCSTCFFMVDIPLVLW